MVLQWNFQINTLWDSLFVLSKEVALFGRSKKYWQYGARREYLGTSSCTLCRKIVLVSELPPIEDSTLYLSLLTIVFCIGICISKAWLVPVVALE